MGSDKGLLTTEDKYWFIKNFELLDTFFSKTVISIRKSQLETYASKNSNIEYILDSNQSIEGPLKGILSVHEKYPDHDLFVLACDMIQIKSEIIQDLIAKHESNTGFDFYLYKNQNQLETLCGIYTKEGLQKIQSKLETEPKPSFSIYKLIENLRPFLLPISEENQSYFENFNHSPYKNAM